MDTRTTETRTQIGSIFNTPDPERWQVGDEIEFVKADGGKWIVTILGREKSGELQMMFYTGQPYFFMTTEDELASLRVVRVCRMNQESVTEYRRLLGLDDWPTPSNWLL